MHLQPATLCTLFKQFTYSLQGNLHRIHTRTGLHNSHKLTTQHLYWNANQCSRVAGAKRPVRQWESPGGNRSPDCSHSSSHGRRKTDDCFTLDLTGSLCSVYHLFHPSRTRCASHTCISYMYLYTSHLTKSPSFRQQIRTNQESLAGQRPRVRDSGCPWQDSYIRISRYSF